MIENKIDVNAVSIEGMKWTAILEAATVCNNPEIINLLIKNGANVNQRSVGQWTPLMFAVRSCTSEIVAALIKNGADVNAVNKDIMSALYIAENVYYVKPNIVNLLKKSGAKNNANHQKIQEVKNNAR